MTELNPQSFDLLLPAKPSDRIIWTAEGIALRIGTSADFVRDTLANLEGTPVRQIGGRYCAHEGDLIAFFRASPKQT